MSLQNLTLVTNKKLTNLQDAVIRQSEKGLTITAVFLNEDSSPYDLTNKKVIFNEHKESDKYVVDTNVQITDARNGAISYTLHSQCYAATGEAWFEIEDSSGTVVDSTQNFNLKVKDAANASIYNTNYITQLDALRDQMQQLVDGADGKLKQQLQTTQNQLNQKLTDIGNAYQTAEQGRANAYKQAEANRDNTWNQDKQRIDNEWNQDKGRIDGEWNSQKQAIQNTANSQQSSISSQWSQLKSNADSQLATIKSNINALQATIDDINKNKVPGFNSSLQSAQDKLDKILASLGNFVVSANDVNSIASDKVAEIAGNLIDPNLNNWTKSDAAKQAFKTIDFDAVTKDNSVSFTSVLGYEIIYYKINTKQYSNYRFRFRFTPKTTITSSANSFQVCVMRTAPATNVNTWGNDQGSYNTTTQIKTFVLNKDSFGEVGFYSDNATELYIGFNLSPIRDGSSCNFEISSISVVNVDNTIQSLPKSVDGVKPDSSGNINLQAIPAKFGNANDDLFSFRNTYHLRFYDGNGNDVRNVPFKNNRFSVLVNMRSNWGTLTYFGQDQSIWTAACNGDGWGAWIRQASNNELNRKVNIADSLNRGLIDQGTSWQQIFGNDALNTNIGHLTVFKNSSDDYRPYIYGYSASGIAFGAGDTRGVLSVRWDQPGIMVSGGNGNGPKWARELAIKDDFANYYNKSETDNKVSYLQGQIDSTKSNLSNYYNKSETDTKTSNLQGQISTLQNRCSALETQLSVLQGQMSSLLSAITVSGQDVTVNGTISIKGQIKNYWGGTAQYVAYAPNGARRGYFGFYDGGDFVTKKG
ncbi:BppU family phage baseplate upper protein [Lactobacillus mulieris]|uniref:Phage baseplate upper protein n=1 Tax=Lactobacillus mulieris TaxID=2508708 RepID=A0AAP3GWC8_9LACO|nr:BppU family phage baseplate upper protein [Lactobacillus mulieris]MCZ3844173.1 phage baseplate upper protein [Lactobacillus mulieris]MCZ3875833.1 phage baseplate upper protein [Lactobacillus mulieris]